MTRARSDQEDNGFTDPVIPEDAFLLSVQMRDYHGDIFLNGRKLSFRRQALGWLCIFDYRLEWGAYLRSVFDCINIHMPRSVLSAVTEEQGGGLVETLRYKPGVPVEDPVFLGLVNAIAPAFNAPAEPNQLFLDHLGWAMSAHVAQAHGDITRAARPSKSRLAPWQEMRAKEMMETRLTADISLADLAAECGLSTSHFARAFRATTGVPPYQWLLTRRVERAKEMLAGTDHRIVDIAELSGFADQSHLTRVFSKATGETPAAWRRRNA